MTQVQKKSHFGLKLSENNTLRLLQLYQGESCLYDVNSDDYRNRELRSAALKRIAAALSVDGFGPKEVANKFKNLRNSYSQELKKIRDSETSGTGSDDVYIPTVYWFSVMDAFLRPYLYSRPTKTNLDLKKNSTDSDTHLKEVDECEDEDEHLVQLEASQIGSEYADSLILQEEVVQSPPQYCTLDKETNGSQRDPSNQSATPMRRFAKTNSLRKKPYLSSSQNKSIRETAPVQSNISAAVEKLDHISKLAASITQKERDMYAHFGDYVASVLRKAGEEKAMIMQHEISSVIFRHMLPSSSKVFRYPYLQPHHHTIHLSRMKEIL